MNGIKMICSYSETANYQLSVILKLLKDSYNRMIPGEWEKQTDTYRETIFFDRRQSYNIHSFHVGVLNPCKTSNSLTLQK